jgi:molybdopterin synthase sulfur carrier subunit
VQVEVRLFATLERYLPDSAEGDRATLDLPDDATVADVARCLRVPDDLSFLAAVNGHEALSDSRLRPGDVVALFPPLAGGAACAPPEGR